MLASLLRGDGYDTEVAHDGAAALARLARLPSPDAIVTELHLLHADGLAVARFARFRRPGVALVVVTGHPNALSAALEPRDEPIHVLTKPFDYADLLARLEPAL